MTKEQIQTEYTKVATQAGDAFFKLQSLEAEAAKFRNQLAALTKSKAALEQQLAALNAKEGADVGKAENTPPPA